MLWSLKYLLTILVVGIFALVVLFKHLPDDRMHLYFLDVGQGDAILIKTPENHQILVDGGPKNFLIEELSKAMPYFDNSLDLVVATHPDSDHISGLVEVLKRYKVNAMLLTGVDVSSSIYNELLEELVLEGCAVYFADAKMDFAFGEILLDVLYPFENISGKQIAEVNDSSVVMKIVFENHSILLTGDAGIAVEEALVVNGVDLKADILKVGHHGSKTSSSMEFLWHVEPKTAVIQVGKENSYGHPHVEVLKNLYQAGVKDIFRNDEDGAVEFVF